MDDLDDPASTAPPATNGAEIKAGKRRHVASHAPAQRARITNGSKLLPSVPGTSIWARLLRDNLDAMIVHLGGEAMVSETQRLACRRIAVLETEIIHLEDRIGRLRLQNREPPPELLDLYQRLGNSQRRFCEALGWQRVPKDVTPSLQSYLNSQPVSSSTY
jgi:hypothetical protein